MKIGTGLRRGFVGVIVTALGLGALPANAQESLDVGRVGTVLAVVAMQDSTDAVLAWEPPSAGAEQVTGYEIQRPDGNGDWQPVGTAPAGPNPTFLLDADTNLNVGAGRIRVLAMDADGPILRTRSVTRIEDQVDALDLSRTGLRSYDARMASDPFPATEALTLELVQSVVDGVSPTPRGTQSVLPGSTTSLTYDPSDDGKGPAASGRILFPGVPDRTGSIGMAWDNDPIGVASQPREIAVSQSTGGNARVTWKPSRFGSPTAYRVTRFVDGPLNPIGQASETVAADGDLAFVDTLANVPRGERNIQYRVTPLTGAAEGQSASRNLSLFVRVPSLPRVSLERLQDGSVRVDWTTPKVNPGWITGYDVTRLAWTWPQFQTQTWSLGSNASTLTDDLADIAAGTQTLTYQVRVISPEWASSTSYVSLNAVHVRVPSPVQRLDALQQRDGDVRVDWEKPSTNTNLVTGYLVERQHMDAYNGVWSEWTDVAHSGTSTGAVDPLTDLTQGVWKVRYRVTPTATEANGSPVTTTINRVLIQKADQPERVSVDQRDNGTVRVAWVPGAVNSADVEGFALERRLIPAAGNPGVWEPVGSVGDDARSWDDPLTGVTPGQYSIRYRVSAFEGAPDGPGRGIGRVGSLRGIPVGLPGAPRNVDAQQKPDGTVSLSFRAPRISGAGVTGYVVERTTAESYGDAESPWEQIAEVPAQNGLVEVDDDLDGVSGYAFTANYRVRATTTPDVSDPTAAQWGTARTPILVGRPSQPVDVKSAQRSDGTVKITWGQPAIRQGGVTGYRVERALRTSGEQKVFTTVGYADARDRAWVDELDAVAAGAYTGTYRISATSQGGPADSALYGPGEGTARRVQVAVPAAPRHFTAKSRAGEMVLNWQPPADRGVAVTGYRVFREDWNGTTELPAVSGSTTTTTDVPPQGSWRVTYRVAAVNAAGTGPSIAGSGIFRTNRDVGRVGNLQLTGPVTENGQTVSYTPTTLTWAAPESPSEPIVGYKITRSTDVPGHFQQQTTVGTTTWTDTYADLPNGDLGSVSYSVRAVTATDGGPSTQRRIDSVVRLAAGQPSSPRSIVGDASGENVEVSWEAPSVTTGLSGYRVEWMFGKRSGWDPDGFQELATSATAATFVNQSEQHRVRVRVIALGSPDDSYAEESFAVGPTGLAAQSFTAEQAGRGPVTLSWQAPQLEPGTTLTGWTVSRDRVRNREQGVTSRSWQLDPDELGLVDDLAGIARAARTHRPVRFTVQPVLDRDGVEVQGRERSVVVDVDVRGTSDNAGTRPDNPSLLTLAADATSIAADWDVPAIEGGTPVTSYDVAWRVAGGQWQQLAPVSGTQATITGLSPSTSHQVRVRGVNADGAGPWSVRSAKTTSAAPVVPPGDTTPPGGTTPPGATTPPATPPPGVTPPGKNPPKVAAPGAPGKPGGKSAKGKVRLTWRAASPNGAPVSYTIQVKVKKKWKSVATTRSTSWKGKLKGVKKGSKATVRVIPKNSAGVGKPSAMFKVRVK